MPYNIQSSCIHIIYYLLFLIYRVTQLLAATHRPLAATLLPLEDILPPLEGATRLLLAGPILLRLLVDTQHNLTQV